MRRSISAVIPSVAALALALVTGVAHGQPGVAPAADPPAGAPPAAPAAAAAEPPAAAPRPVAAPAQPPPVAPAAGIETKCLSEIRSDVGWKEQLRNQLRKIVGIVEIVPPSGGHQSVMRASCNALMRTNIKFRDDVREKILLPDVRAQLADVIRVELHTTDSARMLRNKRHVIYAYSFLWVCMVGFIMFMWSRQRKLSLEIERLRHDLDRAAQE